jgi:hypothetical protein
LQALLAALKILADGGCTIENFAQGAKEILGTSAEIAKCSELHTFAETPKRCMVEHSFA